jgi:hypothetical protein
MSYFSYLVHFKKQVVGWWCVDKRDKETLPDEWSIVSVRRRHNIALIRPIGFATATERNRLKKRDEGNRGLQGIAILWLVWAYSYFVSVNFNGRMKTRVHS